MGQHDNKNSGTSRNTIHTKLSDILDFGPDKIAQNKRQDDQTERLKKLIKQMKEINSRVDKLTERF